jgi:hypothetical protein
MILVWHFSHAHLFKLYKFGFPGKPATNKNCAPKGKNRPHTEAIEADLSRSTIASAETRTRLLASHPPLF